ncbi:MAG: hypothetical protein Q3960_02315 [Lactobacillus sp.]|nr:hypothetical protein [Lactobacillus sp.]
MKLKKLIKLTTIAVVSFGFYTSFQNNSNVEAKTTLKFPKKGRLGNGGKFIVPKKFRGTWYDKTGKIIIGKSTYKVFSSKDKSESHILLKRVKYPKDFGFKVSEKHIKETKTWLRAYYYKKTDYVNFLWWYRNSGFGDTYFYRTKTINHKKIKMLVVGIDQDPSTKNYSTIMFKSKKLALKYSHIHIKGFRKW